MSTHMKHLGQKYMGIHPPQPNEDDFKIDDLDVEGGHSLPISV